MKQESLFEVLTGIDPGIPELEKALVLSKTGKIEFLFKGHAVEYYLIEGEKRVVSLLFEPYDFLIPSHPTLSEIVTLKDAVLGSMDLPKVEKLRERLPTVQLVYNSIESSYRRKVKDRINMAKHIPAARRLQNLKAMQPWAFELLSMKDIAAYLRVPLSMLKEHRRG